MKASSRQELRSPKLRKTQWVAVAAGLLVGCAGLVGCSSGDEEASCPASFEFEGKGYTQFEDDGRLNKTGLVGQGQYPDCGDTDSSQSAPSGEVDVWQLVGLDPDQGIGVVEGEQLVLYIADDTGDPCQVAYTAC